METKLSLTSDDIKGLSSSELALYFFMMNGYLIHAKNFKYNKTKVDFVVSKGEILIFAIVRTFLKEKTIKPLGEVKQRSIATAAEMFLLYNGMFVDRPQVQYDVVEVHVEDYNSITLTHKQKAFIF